MFPQILEPLGFHIIPGKRPVVMELQDITQIGFEPELVLESCLDLLSLPFPSLQDLDLQHDTIDVSIFVYDDLEFVPKAVDAPYHFLDRRRRKEHSFDFGDVISPSDDTALDRAEGAAARAGFGRPLDHVLGIEANAGLGLAIESGDDHLASSARFLDVFPGFNVLNLNQEKGLVDMEPAGLGGALEAPGSDFRGSRIRSGR